MDRRTRICKLQLTGNTKEGVARIRGGQTVLERMQTRKATQEACLLVL
jgi:hypothetical protein